MKIIESVEKMQFISNKLRKQGHIIGLVPTMGFLHEGHLSLMHKAKKDTERLIISIFVNPTQFIAGEDYGQYPRDIESDIKKSKEVGVDIIFHPDVDEMYSEKFYTYVNVEKITERLCGRSRPGHFRGVATVVAKLFNICKPHKAYFGEKDFQQLLVIKKMVKDLNMDVDVIGLPILRESDGLAMSSRNSYLSKEERLSALSLNRALKSAEDMIKKGEFNAKIIMDEMERIIKSEKRTVIDYIDICNPETLEPFNVIEDKALIAVAVKIGKARLIDNRVVYV